MGVSLSNMGHAISRMAAEYSIDSAQTNRLLARSGADLSQSLIEQKNAAKESENDLRAAASTVQMVQSAANVAVAGAKVGQAASDTSHQQTLSNNVQAGQAESASGTGSTGATGTGASGSSEGAHGDATARVMSTSLGNGSTVGSRYGEQGTRALLRSDLGARTGANGAVTETRAQWEQRVGRELRSAGLSQGEVDQVWNKAKDGQFSTQDAVDVMWANRNTPDQARSEHVREKMRDGILGQTSAFLTRGLNDAAKQEGKNGKRLGEEAKKSSEVADTARDQTVETNERLGELELKGLRQRRGGASAGTSTSR